ncbi:MAG: GAF domain-containing protein, partial [Gaiellaceae bacterium]
MTPDADSAYRRLEQLQSVTDAALGNLSLDELLDELLERIRAALEADTCAVLLIDEEANELIVRAAKGLEEEMELGFRIPVGAGFAGRVAAERRPVVIDDADHADLVNPVLRKRGIRSLLGVPLIVQDRVLGVVHVGTLSPRTFTAEDVELLELVALRVAAAMERTLVHEELVRLEELERSFISLASHELRTPASVVFGIAATLYERGHALSDDQLDELREALYHQSLRLKRLIEQL